MKLRKLNVEQSVFSGVTVRNLLLIVAGALLFFWPLAQKGFASIVACTGCSCVSQVIDGLASCTAVAQCTPEGQLLIVYASVLYTCPNQPVANEATTTGYIGGYNIYLTEYAQALAYGRVCYNWWGLQQCDGYKTSGVITNDLYCCSPPPPPPPPSGGGGCTHVLTCTDGYAWDSTTCDCEPDTPIILDVDGKGFDLTSAQGGVMFDISGTGHPIQMGWTAPNSTNGFLALPGPDGLVRNGKQLFGNFTPQPPSSSPNGFAALAVYDLPANGGNGDGMIDARDAISSSLRLWIDVNHDGISEPEELYTLPSLGVTSISLTYNWSGRTDQYGNLFRYRAQVNPGEAASTGRMAYDVFFVTLPPPTTKNVLPTFVPGGSSKCPVPTKTGMLAASSTGKL